jgi:small ligand-binding sensory domain FIST
MRVKAATTLNLEADSTTAAKLAAQSVLDQFGPDKLSLMLVYGTINHEQAALLSGIRSTVGPEPLLIGCSAQGVVANGKLTEEGYGLGVMGFGGSELVAVSACEREVCIDTYEKSKSIATKLKSQSGREPALVGMLYDASCGTNVQELLAGMRSVLNCPFIGGGASLSWGLPVSTFQYFDTDALKRSLVAFALSGPIEAEIGICHGTSPTGVVMTVTRAEGNRILELDGQPAAEVFRDATGHIQGEVLQQEHLVSWAIAVERMVTMQGPHGPEQRPMYLIRAANGIDYATGAVSVQAGFPVGTRVAFHHRTVDAVLNGTKTMAEDLAMRIQGRKPLAMLGFECRGRTVPFLGTEVAMAENADLGARLGPDIPWLGMLAWGEIAHLGSEPAFHNYTYPLAVLVER